MKKLFFSAAILTLILGISSCSKSTSCGDGYEGSGCLPVSQKFVGTYYGSGTVSVNGTPVQGNDTINITAGTTPKAIVLNGWSSQPNIIASVNGNTITIPEQTITLRGASFDITSGSGTLSGSTITYTYSGTDGTSGYVVSAADTKH